MSFLTFPSLSLTSKSAQKRGGTPTLSTSPSCCQKCQNCPSYEQNNPELVEEAFKDRILNSNYKVIFDHIKGKDNSIADKLSRCLFLEQVMEKPP